MLSTESLSQEISTKIREFAQKPLREIGPWAVVRYRDHLDVMNTFKIIEHLNEPAIMTDTGMVIFENNEVLVLLIRNSSHKSAEGVIATIILQSTIKEREELGVKKRGRKVSRSQTLDGVSD